MGRGNAGSQTDQKGVAKGSGRRDEKRKGFATKGKPFLNDQLHPPLGPNNEPLSARRLPASDAPIEPRPVCCQLAPSKPRPPADKTSAVQPADTKQMSAMGAKLRGRDTRRAPCSAFTSGPFHGAVLIKKKKGKQRKSVRVGPTHEDIPGSAGRPSEGGTQSPGVKTTTEGGPPRSCTRVCLLGPGGGTAESMRHFGCGKCQPTTKTLAE